MPGPYRFELTPYLREILDCFSVDNPIREVTMMKGAQVGATVTAENVLGYFIEHVRTAPILWASADSDLAKGRLTSNIIPMLHESGLMHLMRSVDEGNSRKTGKTDEKLEWDGGGFCIPFGAKNAAKMRQWSIQVLVNDEIDGWPTTVGKDGDPLALFRDRTRAFEGSRKIFNISTPTILGQSKIHAKFLEGDRRYYNVRCLSCEFPQVLCFQKFTTDGGVQYGLTWDYDSDGHLIAESVRFLCKNCQRAHFESDKTRLLDPRNGAEWVPTAPPSTPTHRSYHLGGLYSPAGMASWAGQVEQYLEAYDHRRERFKDLAKLQVFYNNVLGEAYEQRGEKVRMDAVSGHRRAAYRFGEVPNKYAIEHCLSPILCVTCAVDVHAEQLPTAVYGWTRGRRPFLLDYWRFGEIDPKQPERPPGNTEQLDDPQTWTRLRELIENREYVADDGKKYRIQFTLIDSGYRADQVYDFANEYASGVSPAKGREQPRGTSDKQFAQFHTPTGVAGYLITVDWYKDRLSAALRREWDGTGVQPNGCFNAPSDVTEKQLRELTVETKVAKPGAASGYEWRRPSGSANELWDLLVYNSCALDLIAWDVCRNQLELEEVDWPQFWDLLEREKVFFTE
jgi:phage terminase large subunit GpA-like protein